MISLNSRSRRVVLGLTRGPGAVFFAFLVLGSVVVCAAAGGTMHIDSSIKLRNAGAAPRGGGGGATEWVVAVGGRLGGGGMGESGGGDAVRRTHKSDGESHAGVDVSVTTGPSTATRRPEGNGREGAMPTSPPALARGKDGDEVTATPTPAPTVRVSWGACPNDDMLLKYASDAKDGMRVATYFLYGAVSLAILVVAVAVVLLRSWGASGLTPVASGSSDADEVDAEEEEEEEDVDAEVHAAATGVAAAATNVTGAGRMTRGSAVAAAAGGAGRRGGRVTGGASATDAPATGAAAAVAAADIGRSAAAVKDGAPEL